jgi:hypothetical protein
MSAVIISAVLLVVVISASLSSFSGREIVLNAESKERSMALADACVSELLLRIAAGTQTNAPVTVVECTIQNQSSPYMIHAVFNRAHTNLRVTVDSSLAITSWVEVP